jgi:hypothetical protein
MVKEDRSTKIEFAMVGRKSAIGQKFRAAEHNATKIAHKAMELVR